MIFMFSDNFQIGLVTVTEIALTEAREKVIKEGTTKVINTSVTIKHLSFPSSCC